MAKKTRRRKEIAQQRAIRQAAANVATATTRPSASASAISPAAPAGSTVDLSEEYRYVRADLRRIAILATSIIAILVVLSFVI